MSAISLNDLTVRFDEHFQLEAVNWRIDPGQHWAIVGPNGSGKSALTAVLYGAGDRVGGSVNNLPEHIGVASFEAQAELIEVERTKDDADILDVIPVGTPVQEILDQTCADNNMQQRLIEAFGFTQLLDRGFRKLSSGESRKVMLIRAMTSAPELLILDEPYEGLDIASQEFLAGLLLECSRSSQVILVLNRFDEIPGFVTHIGYMDSGRLAHCVDRSDAYAVADLEQLLHMKTTDIAIPGADPGHQTLDLPKGTPLVRMRKARVAYGDDVIFSDLDWTIEPGQHWQVTGPNGSGKTCLLNLITGDHPQCYVNDLLIFGMQRGSGESIWDIKQHLGYVSSALQWEYKVSVNVRNTIISGFYDSIGIYQKYSDSEKAVADQWLQLMGMSDKAELPFAQLSFGDQRLILIARAMVKHPPLLILDEPCLGLDDINRQLVLGLIERICAGTETTVLYVNHRAQDTIAGIQHHLSMG